jgi:zinc protease
MRIENADKIGVSNMLADLMTKGTKNKTGAIRNAIESLGATIRAYATDESIFISVNTLAKITMLPWDLFKKYCYNPLGR